MLDDANPFIVVPESLAPNAGGQWFLYRFSISVRNETTERLILTTDTVLAFGEDSGHPSEASLARETPVDGGQTVSLAFDRTRICGRLPAGEYQVELRLAGRDEGDNPVIQTIVDTGNPLKVTPAAQNPVNSIGAGMAYWTFVVSHSAQYAKVNFGFRTSDIYPDDVTLEWQTPPEHFDVFLEDGTPLVDRHVVSEVATVDWVAVPLHFRPHTGLAADTTYTIGVLIAKRQGIHCWHEGLHAGVGAGGTIRSIICAEANLDLVCTTVESYELRPGQPFHANVCASNPKLYQILTDAASYSEANDPLLQIVWDGVKPDSEFFVRQPATGEARPRPSPTTRLRVLQDGNDVSDKFTIDDITGAGGVEPGGSGIVTLVVRSAADVPPGWYRIYPVLGSYANTHGEAGYFDPVSGSVDGEQTTPQVFDWIKVRQ